MRSDLLGVVDAFDRALAAAAEVVDPAHLEPIAAVVKATRARLGYLGDSLLVAVAGGTGSGKSSLINAVAGEAVAETGGMRPTTSVPLAWIPANPEPGLVRLLDDLGIAERVGHHFSPHLALLDLPDTDSIVVDHRYTVEALLPRVDLVIWVLDPEKYRDRALHERYLAPLAGYHRQFVFVLNQIDRLEEGAVASVVADLEQSLSALGIPRPKVVPMAADPDVGPPRGVGELTATLASMMDEKRLVYDKLRRDLAAAASSLSALPDLAGPVGFAPRWESVSAEAAASLAAGDRRGAKRRLQRFLAELAAELGGARGAALSEEIGEDVVEEAVAAAVEATGAYRPVEAPPSPRWAGTVRWVLVAVAALAAIAGVDSWRGGEPVWPAAVTLVVAAGGWLALGAWLAGVARRRLAAAESERRRALEGPIQGHLDRQLGRRLRALLRARAGAGAAVTELRLALAELERLLDSG